MNKRVIIFGTRPEFLKLLPVIVEIRQQNSWDDYCYIYTGQHPDLVEDLFELFDFSPSFALKLKKPCKSLSNSFSRILSGLQEVIDGIKKDFKISFILGQGDTTSCACAAFTAFFNQIPFVHVEAGLRTYDQANPFPEEFFRRIISLASTINFAPTITAKENLIREGITKEKIIVTGNTIVDTIELLRQRASGKISENSVVRQFSSKNIILITCHRRENQDEKFLELIDSIKTLATGNKSVQFVWISHVTPFIRKHLTKEKFKALNNIVLLPPVNVYEMISLYDKTLLIITDSGGIQEEAPSFNIPVILIRNHTERSESVEKGYSKVIGLKKEKIIGAFNELTYQRPSDMVNPYGNGHAAKLILSHLGKCF